MPPGVGTGLAPVAEEEQLSEHEYEVLHDHRGGGGRRPVHSSEIDDFSRAYSSAGIGTEEMDYDDDRHPLAVINPDDSPPRSGTASPGDSQSPSRGGAGGTGTGGGIGNRPLWQQNRQQGRNLMWL